MFTKIIEMHMYGPQVLNNVLILIYIIKKKKFTKYVPIKL